MARPAFVASALALLACVLACAAGRGPAGVPSHIATAAGEQGCTPYGDLEDTDVEEAPWWVSLEPLTGGAGDSAFLCEAPDDEVTWVILDVRSPINPWASCPPLVGELSWWPSGISFLTPEDPVYPRGTLGAWEDATGDPGPTDVALSGPVIDTSLQIAGYLFYCHEGRWLAWFDH
jgi:hypothetical protein